MLKITEFPKLANDYCLYDVDNFNVDFSVKINGVQAPVYNTRCSAIPFNRDFKNVQRSVDQSELLGFVSFESDESVEIEVVCKKPFSVATVRPLARKVTPVAVGQTVRFSLDKKGQYVLELDDEHTSLTVVFDEIKSFEKKENYTYYFGEGIYYEGSVNLKSGDRVYVDRNAKIFGGFFAQDAENIVIEGYGTVDGSLQNRADTQFFNFGNLKFVNCKNVEIFGLTLQDSPFWVTSFFNCENVLMDNVKITGQWRFNTDGVDIVSCKDVTVKNSFLHVFDDVVTIKGYSHHEKSTIHVIENIKVDNCIFWCGWGRSIEFGIETIAREYKNITFSNCDLIHNSASAIDIQNGNCARLHDITIENINVEFQKTTLPEVYQRTLDMKYDGYGKTGMPYLIWIDNHKYAKYVFSGYMLDLVNAYADDEKVFGTVEDVTIRNINVYADDGLPNFKVKIFSESENVVFNGITVENVFVNGKKVTDPTGFDTCIDERTTALRLFV